MKAIKSILCVLTEAPGSDYVLKRAVTLAQNNQAALVAVMIAPRRRVFRAFAGKKLDADRLEQAIRAGLEARLAQLVRPFVDAVDIETRILQGTAFLQIIREVLRNHHDLVIKVPDDEDFIEGLVGSDDMHLLRKCPCPVWLAKPQKIDSYNRILAAVDIDDTYAPAELESRRALNRAVLEMASAMAVSEFAELHVVHAWTAVGEKFMRGGFLDATDEQISAYLNGVRKGRQQGLENLVAGMTGKEVRQALDYLKPKLHLVKGLARREIPILARNLDVDLLVLGTVARTGIPGLIVGSTAESILSQVQCSVLAIKPPGFETPIRLQDAE